MPSLFKKEYQKINSEGSLENEHSFIRKHREAHTANKLLVKALVVVLAISASMNALWIYHGFQTQAGDACVSDFGEISSLCFQIKVRLMHNVLTSQLYSTA